MKNITIQVTDCPMWKRLDVGTVLRMPLVQADEAINNNWARESENDLLLLGEKIRKIKEKNNNDKNNKSNKNNKLLHRVRSSRCN